MGNKYSLRYGKWGIWIFIISVSLLSILMNNFISKNFIKESGGYFKTSIKLENYIYDSLYSQENISYNKNDSVMNNDYFTYYLRSYKIKNYPFTKEYKEKHPDQIVSVDKNGNYSFSSKYEENNDIENQSYYKSNNEIEEDPIYVTNYLSNTLFNEKFNPQTIEIKKNLVYVKGFYENGKINIVEENQGDGEKSKLLLSEIKTSLSRVYNDMDSINGIKKINFLYTLNPDSKELGALLQYDEFSNNELPTIAISILISSIIFLLMAIISNYDKTKKITFYKGISRFPVEIVIFLSFLWLMLGISLDQTLIIQYIYKFINIVQFILTFTIGLAIYFYVHSIKSIYNDGKNSFVFQNSIIFKILRAISNFFKNNAKILENSLSKNIGKGYFKKFIVFLGFLIILGFLASTLVVRDGFEFIVFILWLIFMYLIYKYLNKFILSFDNILITTEKISKGNYSVKIDKEDNQFKALSENINNISDNLDSAIENAIKSERLKTELITNVSHDLKTPLTSILNYSQLINCEKSNIEDIKEYAKIINEKSHKLKDLIEDLFEVSKVNSNNIELNLEKLDFKSLLEQVLGEWEDKLDSKNLLISTNLPKESIFLNLDGIKTSRILDNLFSNIYKYSLENTRVYVDLYNSEDGVELIIKNISKYPLNISPEELIERFKRGDSSRNTQGSGLGLSIASSLTNVQGGIFEIEIDGDLFKTIIKF